MSDVSALYGQMSANSYLLKGNKNVIIDPGIHSELDVLNWLEENGLKPEDIDEIYLTHAHADHFVNCKLFSKAKIYASEEARKYLDKKDSRITASLWFNNEYYPEVNGVLKEGDIVRDNNYSLVVISLPGHSDDGIGLYDKKNKILFSGDTLFEATCGRYDLTNSNRDDLIKSLKKLSILNYRTLLSGHGYAYETNTEEEQKENIERILKHYF